MSDDDFWCYTRRCLACGEDHDYMVDRKGMDYRAFERIVLMHPIETFLPCEDCGRQTLQKLVAYHAEPEPEEESNPEE